MVEADASFADVERLARAGRLAEAFDLIVALADRGDGEALVTLADFYWQGGPVPQDPRRARDLFRRAAEAGEPMGRIFHTNLLASGIFGERDWRGAVERLKGEVVLDDYRARVCTLIGSMALDEQGGPACLPEPEAIAASIGLVRYPALFTPAECALVLAAADQRFMPSTIQDAQGREVPHPLRSSDGAPIHWLIEDPAIQALNRRLAAASATAYEQAEPLLVLRYRPGQQYRLHLDALPGLANQRVKTALVYLNDDYAGGETEFPRLGLKVKGQVGDVVVFDNLLPDGSPNPLSEHAGLPVLDGVKFLGSRWIRKLRHIP